MVAVGQGGFEFLEDGLAEGRGQSRTADSTLAQNKGIQWERVAEPRTMSRTLHKVISASRAPFRLEVQCNLSAAPRAPIVSASGSLA